MIQILFKSLGFGLILSSMLGHDAWAASDLPDQEGDEHEEILLENPASCEVLLGPIGGTGKYYASHLPDSGGYRFNKKELTVLFKIKERAQIDPNQTTTIADGEEQRLIGLILKRKISPNETFTHTEITDKILFGAFYRLALKFARERVAIYTGLDFDDVAQAAVIALHKAIGLYDYHTPYMFSTWAYKLMQNSFNDVFVSQISHWRIIGTQNLLSILRISASLRQKTGAENPSAEDIAEVYNSRHNDKITTSLVNTALMGVKVDAQTSSEIHGWGEGGRLESDERSDSLFTSVDMVEDEDTLTLDEIINRSMFHRYAVDAIESLDLRSIKILGLHFGFYFEYDGQRGKRIVFTDESYSHEEIAKIFGLSRVRIDQIYFVAMVKLRQRLRDREIIP